jgi:hypothetical protein
MRSFLAVVAVAILVPATAFAQGSRMVINEFVANPDGSDTGKEWVELYNAGGDEQNLDGWKLKAATKLKDGGTYSTKVTFDTHVVPAGGFFVICETEADCPVTADLIDPMSLPNGTGGDGLQLTKPDNGDVPVDTVAYGDSANADLIEEDGGAVASNLAPKPGNDQAIARRYDGDDTDVSGQDFWIAPSSTPGATNPTPPPCEATAVPPDVTINEFLPNPDGTDAGYEWVELYNSHDSAVVKVEGWSLLVASNGDSYNVKVTLSADKEIGAESYFLIGESSVPNTDEPVAGTIAMGTGFEGDGVRLIDCEGTVVDTVVFGDQDNEDLVVDDSGSAATSIAPKPGSGESVARKVAGVDTDLSGDDFFIPDAPTPGAANPALPPCEPTAEPPTVTINEFLPNPDGDDGEVFLEWVELYNSDPAVEVSLEGWSIRVASSGNNYGGGATISLGKTVAAESYFLIGEAMVADADETLEGRLGMGTGTGGDGIRLVDCEGTFVDTVVFGDQDNEQELVDDSGDIALSIAPKPGSGESVARREAGVDTDLCWDDFFIPDTPTPGAENPVPPICEVEAGWVVINEFVPNPAGTDSGFEWVELYNAHATDTLRLDDWVIRAATSGDSYSAKFEFPAETSIPSGGYLVVAEDKVPSADFFSTLGLGNGSDGDGVRLTDCVDTVADTVVYGDEENKQAVVDDSGSVATSVAPMPGDGASLARKENGVDTDLSGDDFTLSNDPTPGAANPLWQCFPSTGDVLLNEFLPDPDGSDDEQMLEWVELYNAGSADLQIDGWQIIAAGKPDDTAVDVIVPPNSTIAAGDFFVVGRANVAEADYSAEFSIGNGTSGDGVSLLDCQGDLVDVIVFGSNNEDEMLDESGEIASPAPNPGGNRSLARIEDGVDSDDPGDWYVDISPTPGATNYQEILDVPDENGKGCGKDTAPAEGDPGGCGSPDEPREGGCTTVPLPFGGMELLLGVVVALRRRRSDPR